LAKWDVARVLFLGESRVGAGGRGVGRGDAFAAGDHTLMPDGARFGGCAGERWFARCSAEREASGVHGGERRNKIRPVSCDWK